MNTERLDLIPDPLLWRRDASDLITWLADRGWSMSLLDLDAERRRRGIRRTAR